MCHDSTWSPSSLAQKFLLVQSSFNQYTAIIMGKTSKNQNYFLISAVILGNILTCFTKPYNYPDSLFKTLFFTAICVLYPSNPDVNARPIPWPINEDPDKDKQETRKAQQPSRGRRNWRTDNLSSVVAQQSGKCPSAPSREPQPHLQTKGGSCWEVGAQFRGFLWDQAAPTPGLWLQSRGQRLPTPRVVTPRRSAGTQSPCLALGSHRHSALTFWKSHWGALQTVGWQVTTPLRHRQSWQESGFQEVLFCKGSWKSGPCSTGHVLSWQHISNSSTETDCNKAPSLSHASQALCWHLSLNSFQNTAERRGHAGPIISSNSNTIQPPRAPGEYKISGKLPCDQAHTVHTAGWSQVVLRQQRWLWGKATPGVCSTWACVFPNTTEETLASREPDTSGNSCHHHSISAASWNTHS